MSEVKYRWIDGRDASEEDWEKIESILIARGWMSLNRPTTRILVAEEEGKLLGFTTLQLVPHAEPLWVAPSQRATGLAEDLADKMLEFLIEVKVRGWMVVADSPFAEKICKERGMLRVESPVYVAK
jgi:hypothetical protein